VVERPRVDNRYLNTHLCLYINVDKNRDRAGPFRGIRGTLEREWRGECCGYSEVFYVVAPAVSVKDRGVGTRDQVLNILIV
jgi:hypothetical protein